MHDKTNYKDPRDLSKGIMVAQDIKLNIKCSPKKVSFECFPSITNVFGKRVPEDSEEGSVTLGSAALGPG